MIRQIFRSFLSGSANLNQVFMSSKRSLSDYRPRRPVKKSRTERFWNKTKMRGSKVTEGTAGGTEVGQSSTPGITPANNTQPEPGPAPPCEILATPKKAFLDKKEYRVIRLANGLTALLISDINKLTGPPPVPYQVTEEGEDEEDDDDDEDEEEAEEGSENNEEEEADVEDTEEDDLEAMGHSGNSNVTDYLSAASLTVGVGSFEDPFEIQGLMHFLEHMVFMGSEKFPKENAFDYYIKKHGGYDNAHTDMEHTTFYFEVQENHFYGGLDRFAQFFVKPLMKVEAMTREREAVHSEFQMAQPEDASRLQQLFASFANENHPMSKFTWGNETTLNVDIPDEELHKKLHDLRLRFYSARNMTLAVQARFSLDVLQDYVCRIFSDVPDSGLPRPVYSQFGFPFSVDKLHHLYRVVPMRDYHSVEINWTLPSLLKHYHTKPLHYISHLIGHEGRGSILSFLKKKVWAVGLYSGNDESGFEHNSTYAVMSISVEMTDEGFKNVDKVINVVFQYLAMLKEVGPVERIFREIQQTEKLSFDYAEELTAVDNVENLSENMQLYDIEDYLSGDTLLKEYNPELIKECLDELTPKTANIIISSKSYEEGDTCNLKEKWFGTKYSIEDIPQEWEKHWNNMEKNSDLHLPTPNKFIPDNFDLLIPESDVSDYPEKLCEDEWGELWFKQDQKFKLPRSYCSIYILTHVLHESPKMGAMIDLYLNLFRHHVMEDIYPASMALYSYSILASERGIIIRTNGFNQKLHQLIDLLMHHMETFKDHFDEHTFQEIKQQQMKAYHNETLKPGNVRKDIRLSILQNVHWTAPEKMKELKTITSKDLMEEFVAKLFPTCYIRILLQGNTQASQAKEIYNLVKSRKLKSSVMDAPFPEMRTCKLPYGVQVARTHTFNPADTNSSIINYYQGDCGTIKTEVLNEFIQMVMDEPVFDFLRTQEQLGYNVCCTNRNTFGILGFSITVNPQANKYDVSHVNERIETFLTHFMDTVKNMGEEEIETLKQTLINTKQTIDLTLSQEVGRNWTEITDGEYIFDRQKKQIAVIKELTKECVVKYLESLVSSKDNPHYRKLCVQVIGAVKPENGVTPSLDDPPEIVLSGQDKDNVKKDFAENQFILDINKYKKQLDLYPVTKIL